MAGDFFAADVRFFVASEEDEASRNQREALLELASWDREEAFGGAPSWRLRDMVLVTISDLHLFRDHLDRDLQASFGDRADLVVYLSKHRSESRRPSLTVHPIGNPRAAEFGGQPETLVPSAPQWMTAALRGLRREATGLAYEVTFEATHHGPYLTAPTFYIEQAVRRRNGRTSRHHGRSRAPCWGSGPSTPRSRSDSAEVTTSHGIRTLRCIGASRLAISSRPTRSKGHRRRSSIARSSGRTAPRSRTCTARACRSRRPGPSRNVSNRSDSAWSGRRTSRWTGRTKLDKPSANTKRPGRGRMLKECRSHGFFRDEFCPHCGSEGKFLLNDEEVEILGRTMAGVLRHFPERSGLEMDTHGWVDLREFITG